MTDTPAGYVPALRFHWLTPAYDAVVGATTRERAFKQALIRQADIRPGQQVLDLACGSGTLAIWLKQHEPQAHITGIDGDADILAIARRKAAKAGTDIALTQALSYDLPCPSEHFDRALSSLFFHHLSRADKRRTARELLRILKPGAELHVADWGRPTGALMRGLFLSIQMLDGWRNTQDNVEGRLPKIFTEAGFVDVAVRQNVNTVYGTLKLYSARKPG